MSTPPGCGPLETLREMARASRGGSPAYTMYHIYRALELIGEHPRGRPLLARSLGLGEASARTLLRRLRSWGLVDSGYRGNRLTGAGVRVLEAVRSSVEVLELGGIVWPESAGVYTPSVNPPVDIVSVYRVRDHLVMHGCREALIGGYTARGPVFPGVPEDLASRLAQGLPPRGPGLLVIVPSACLPQAFDAVVEVILSRCKPGG
ncbi:MAG: hypothetical protein GSR84_01245 [Desulfurococcales archaeon]|nr:hypothetical protein [Desulfurococcales archaeon]